LGFGVAFAVFLLLTLGLLSFLILLFPLPLLGKKHGSLNPQLTSAPNLTSFQALAP
jgi:hypothetical protein